MDILYGYKLNRLFTASHITLSLLVGKRLVVYSTIYVFYVGIR